MMSRGDPTRTDIFVGNLSPFRWAFGNDWGNLDTR
jgi:hypothetical protein